MTEQALAVSFARALEDILARVCISGREISPGRADPQDDGLRVAIAYSGGLDSSVLLHLLQHSAIRHRLHLFAFHIHHGLSRHADNWHMHCQQEAQRVGMTFNFRRVQLSGVDRGGVEEAARLARYTALGELCRQHDVRLLLTAHHQDDQAETLLLQLMRGSGVPGLSGMDRVNTAAGLLGDAKLLVARPLLGVTRSELEAYAQDAAITYVTDESNQDVRYTRNALRHQVMPMLHNTFPGFQERLSRTALHMQSAQRLLDDLAQLDLVKCGQGSCLDLLQLQELSRDRIDNLLRYWLSLHDMRMPSTAWLTEMRTQLLQAKADAQLCVQHPDGAIRRYRNHVYLTPNWEQQAADVGPVAFRWQGEREIDFPAYHGSLHFDAASQGLEAGWLREQLLELHYRQGGERLKLAANRSTRSLKHHYQEMHVPPWERNFLPLVTVAGKLVYAAGIGMDCHHVSAGSGERILLRWSPKLPGK